VSVGKVAVDRISLEQVLATVADSLVRGTRKTFFYANSHAVTLAERDPEFVASLRTADAIFCDGFGVYVASRILGAAVPERFSPPDWIERLGEVVRSNGASMFFLGSREGIAAQAALRVEAALPGLKIYSHHGHFEKSDAQSRRVVEEVNRSGASVLLVGFGMPVQENWITRYRDQLRPNVVITVGALFDYASGTMTRGPKWLTQHGFEWLTRLVLEPRRLWRRYLVGLPQFGLLVAKQRLLSGDRLRVESH
jgi:N-acetylglucosaminyldiphosphoundecaprenol N-acetyl-beta-D-mannosaminyltransferase